MVTSNIRRSVRSRRAVAVIYLTMILGVLCGFAALAVDVGRVVVARTQLRRVADAAALSGAMSLSGGTAAADAVATANANTVDGRTFSMQTSDVETGSWSSHSFTTGGSPTNAVRVTARYTAARGGGVPSMFGQLLGLGTLDLTAKTVATTGTTQTFGVVGLTYVKLSGGSTNSYNSSTNVTGYSSSPTSQGTVESNGNITLSGSASITGDAMAGIGHSVSTSGSANVSGTSGNVTQAISYPNATAGTASTTNGNANLSSTYFNSTSRNLNVSGGNNMTVPGGTYYLNDMVLSGGSTLTFTGPVTVYVTGKVDLSGGSVSTAGSLPGNFELQVCSTQSVTVSGSSGFYADIYCPQSDFNISGSGILAGRIIAKSITQSGSATVYYDQSLGGAGTLPELVQ